MAPAGTSTVDTKGRDLPDTFFYDAAELPLPQYLETELPRSHVALHAALSLDTSARNNVHFVGEEDFISFVGNTLMVVNIASGSVRYLFGRDGRGIGAVAVHPSGAYFAVGELGLKPSVRIYEYPSLRLYRELRGGTELSYLAMAFNGEGTKVASVGGYPDFLLTVWDWKREAIILRNKAFAQAIYNVSFLQHDDGFLTTSGMGHIRFWKMASTFTGLKLQGDIGKFGKVELSDISAYAELPDNKVLSGSENGSLLLWEGKFIKLEVRRPGGELPHEGEVHCVMLVAEDSQTNDAQFITGGDDGVLRWWPLSTIDMGEVSEDDPYLEVAPTRELVVPGVKVRSLVRSPSGSGFLLQDRAGGIWSLREPVTPTSELELVVSAHAGAVRGLDTSPADHFAASTGDDGTVRLWDYVEKRLVYRRDFASSNPGAAPVGGTALTWAPPSVDMGARTVAVGFSDGVVRVLLRCKSTWKRIAVFKPHGEAVLSIQYSPDGKRVATAGKDGIVFILDLVRLGHDADAVSYEPFGFVTVADSAPANSIAWNEDGRRILVGSNRGTVEEIVLPDRDGPDAPDTSESFELCSLQRRRYDFKRLDAEKEAARQEAIAAAMAGEGESQKASKGKESDADERDGDEATSKEEPIGDVLAVVYAPGTEEHFYASLSGTDAGPLYECSFESEHPITILPGHGGFGEITGIRSGSTVPSHSLRYSWSGRFLVSGGQDGHVRARPVGEPACFASALLHAEEGGGALQAVASFDDRFILSGGSDGGMFALRMKPDKMELYATQLGQSVRDSTTTPTEGREEFGQPLYTVDELKGTGLSFDRVIGSAAGDVHDEAYENALVEVEDIVDPNEYSIQEAKLKNEEDNRKRAAEKKKDLVRQQVRKLQEDFAGLREENSADPVVQQHVRANASV